MLVAGRFPYWNVYMTHAGIVLWVPGRLLRRLCLSCLLWRIEVWGYLFSIFISGVSRICIPRFWGFRSPVSGEFLLPCEGFRPGGCFVSIPYEGFQLELWGIFIPGVVSWLPSPLLTWRGGRGAGAARASGESLESSVLCSATCTGTAIDGYVVQQLRAAGTWTIDYIWKMKLPLSSFTSYFSCRSNRCLHLRWCLFFSCFSNLRVVFQRIPGNVSMSLRGRVFLDAMPCTSTKIEHFFFFACR